jgi:exopolysaccharide biosynthesis protein
MITLSGWTPQFVGIDQASATIVDAGDTSVAYIDRVNLSAPGIGFAVTPQSGTMQTISQTTSQFLLSSGTQAAINANFFAPCCDAFTEPKSLIGLSVSAGNVVSPANYGSDDAASSLLISASNQASVLEAQPAGSTVNLRNIYNAVSGNLIVSAGQDVSSIVPTGAPHDPFGLDPRTDVGLSQDGQYLYLAVIDGRQPGYSAGVTDSDAARLLIDLGSYEGINLDGGGSTALVQSDGKGGAAVINSPSGGAERFDGNNLGVFAESLPVPEPSSGLLAGMSLLLLTACSRFRGTGRR